MHNPIPFEASIEVSDEATPIVTVPLEGRCERLWLEMSNGGDAALSEFVIQIQAHPAGPWRDYVGGADFAAPCAEGVEWVSAQPPHTLASGQSACARIDVAGLWAARLLAATAEDTAAIACRGCAT